MSSVLFLICFVEFSVVLDCKVPVGDQEQEGGMSSCLTSAGASRFLPFCAHPRMSLFGGWGRVMFNLHAEHIMRNAGLEEAQAGIKIARRNINNLR